MTTWRSAHSRTAESLSTWVRRIPDGAISVETEGSALVLRASRKLQERFEELPEGRKAGTLSPEGNQEYDAVCELDDALSRLNRLLRNPEND